MKCARNLECRIAVLLLILMNVGVTGPAVAETTDQVLTSYINAVNASMPPLLVAYAM